MTDLLLDRLSMWGCDVPGAMERTLNDKNFYLSCLKLLCDEDGFRELGARLDENDADKAFEAAHMLKGVTGNLGVTPIYNAVCDIVEPLRVGQLTAREKARYQDIINMRDKLAWIIGYNE